MFAQQILFCFLIYTVIIVLVTGIKYRVTQLNACVSPCEEELVSLVECAVRCSLSQNCKAITFNLENSTCCECSNIGVPDQVADLGRKIFRTENGVSICNRRLAEEVPDSHLTATSWFSTRTNPSRGRLHSEEGPVGAGAWVADGSLDLYIQVRFFDIKEVFGVVTQGRHGYGLQYVTSFKVSYSVDCTTFSYIKETDNSHKIFPGNSDRDTIVRNDLPESVLAVCVRIHPVTYISYPSMRFDVIGCDLSS